MRNNNAMGCGKIRLLERNWPDEMIQQYKNFAKRLLEIADEVYTHLDREPLEFRINWHFIKANLPSKGKILDNGAGPGKYSMELAKLGYNVALTDLTPR